MNYSFPFNFGNKQGTPHLPAVCGGMGARAPPLHLGKKAKTRLYKQRIQIQATCEIVEIVIQAIQV
jgi:hypothetical protein